MIRAIVTAGLGAWSSVKYIVTRGLAVIDASRYAKRTFTVAAAERSWQVGTVARSWQVDAVTRRWEV